MGSTQTNSNFQLPKWIDRDEYPFQTKVININGAKTHYIDEGKGQVILFGHPACAWSFIYRDLIKELSKNNRCIVPEFPGFGFSEMNAGYLPSIKNQSFFLDSFIDKMNLTEVLFLGHDTGGPSGFHLAAQRPSLFKGFILTDTIIYPTSEYLKLHLFLGILGTWPMKWINQTFNLVVKAMLNNLKSNKVEEHVQRQYFKAFDTKAKRERVRGILLSLRNLEI